MKLRDIYESNVLININLVFKGLVTILVLIFYSSRPLLSIWCELRNCEIYNEVRLNGRNSLTSSPFSPAGQLTTARLPEMKSFWTSMTRRADTGRTICKLINHVIAML